MGFVACYQSDPVSSRWAPVQTSVGSSPDLLELSLRATCWNVAPSGPRCTPSVVTHTWALRSQVEGYSIAQLFVFLGMERDRLLRRACFSTNRVRGCVETL